MRRAPLTRMPTDDTSFSSVHFWIFSYLGSIFAVGYHFGIQWALAYQIATTLAFWCYCLFFKSKRRKF